MFLMIEVTISLNDYLRHPEGTKAKFSIYSMFISLIQMFIYDLFADLFTAWRYKVKVCRIRYMVDFVD